MKNVSIRSESGDKVIVGEKGLNSYNRVDEAQCEKAIAWWNEHKAFWALVRKGWEQLYHENGAVALQKKVNDTPLCKAMSQLEKKAQDKELTGAALEKAIVSTLQQYAGKKDVSMK